MFREKTHLQCIIVFLFILVVIGLIGTPSSQAQNWAVLAPYNFLWPVYTPALSPFNPFTGLPTPLVSSLTSNTVLPKEPGLVLDPLKESVFYVYNNPKGGLIYFDPEKGFNDWPPSRVPLKLPRQYQYLPIPDAKQQTEIILSSNYAFIERYPNIPYESLLSPDLLFPQWQCYPDLPAPQLVITGTEDYVVDNKEWTRYLMSVVNWAAFPDALFTPSPDLPPCGLNDNAPRTWVDVYSWDGTRLMGFCSLASAESLNDIWFSVPKGEPPPECVYITLEDRRCDRIYTSNCAPTTGQEWPQCIDFEDPPLDTVYYVPDIIIDSGVIISVQPFQWSNGIWTSGGRAHIQNAGSAGGSGQEVWTNNVNLGFGFPFPPSGLSLKFGAYGGNQNIEINGALKNFNDFADIHATTIGGVSVSVIKDPSDAQGILILEGEINQFAIGGQELAIDDVCPHVEGVEIYFADGGEVPGSVYHYQPAIGLETSIYTRPSSRLNSFTFSPWSQDKLYFVNASDNKIFEKDLSGADPETVFHTHTTLVDDLAFNSKGELFFSEATGSAANGKIWRLEKTGDVSLFYTASLTELDGFWSGDFTFDSEDTLYLSSGNRVPASIYRVEVSTNTVTRVYTDNHGDIAGMVFGEDGFLYYANWDTKIYRLNLENGERTVIYQNPARSWLSDVSFPVPEIPPIDAPGVWVMPYGIGGTRLDRIDPNGLTDYTDSISGLFMEDAPFGSRLGFRLGSASVIPTPDLKYYRFQYKHESESGWTDFEATVSVHYVKEKLGDPPTFPIYTLGPHDFGGKNLYEFRPHETELPSLVPVGPGETVSWPSTGFLGDIYSGFLNTEGLPPGNGKYEIKLEVYDVDGNQVLPGASTFDFVVPIGVAPDSTILTDNADPASIDAGGFVFTIHVDNSYCDANVFEPTIGSVGAGDCGFLYYNPIDPNAPPVHISFQAAHPDSFALFRFRIVRGHNTVPGTYVNGYEVSALSAGVYTGDGNGNFEHDFSYEDLLGPCYPEAAFSENLYVFAKATNGWHRRLNKFDASDVRAFALTPMESGISYPMELPAGWSMISLPLMPENASLSSLFPEAVVVYGYEKGVGYKRVAPEENLEVGIGYWILLNEANTYSITGMIIEEYNLPVQNGWYMIGGCSGPAQASVENGIIKVIYGYTPQVGYERLLEPEQLVKGKGYWILFNDVLEQTELTVSLLDY